MLIGFSTNARAGVTWRSSAETLNPSTVMSGAETAQAGADAGAPEGEVALPAVPLAGGVPDAAVTPPGAGVGPEVWATVADEPPAPAATEADPAAAPSGVPLVAVDAPGAPPDADVDPGPGAAAAGGPPALAAAPPPAGVVNSNKFNCPCALSHAFTSPPVRLIFPISTARLVKSTCVSCTSSFPNTT